MAYVPVCDRVAGTYVWYSPYFGTSVSYISIGGGEGRLSLPHKLVLTKNFDIPAALCDVQFGNDNTCHVPPVDPVEHVGMVGFDSTDTYLAKPFHFIVIL